MSRLYFMIDGKEMVRRRALVPKGSVVEAWADAEVAGGTFWVGEESRTLLDAAGPPPSPSSCRPYGSGLPRAASRMRSRAGPEGGRSASWKTRQRLVPPRI